jgi:hypothetical protein
MIDSEAFPDRKDELEIKYNYRKIPIILVDNEFVGGLAELKAKIRENKIILESKKSR